MESTVRPQGGLVRSSLRINLSLPLLARFKSCPPSPRGVEQIEIEGQRAAGNPTAKEQNNSIDPNRTDDKAQRMRQKGQDYLDNKGGSGGKC